MVGARAFGGSLESNTWRTRPEGVQCHTVSIKVPCKRRICNELSIFSSVTKTDDSRHLVGEMKPEREVVAEPIGEQLLTLREAATVLHLSQRTVRGYLKRAEFEGRIIGGRWGFRLARFSRQLEAGHSFPIELRIHKF